MKTLISGSSGMIGKALSSHLINHDCSVVRLVRRPVIDELMEVSWDIDKGEIDSSKLEDFDAVIHLGGVNVADKQWTRGQKAKIMSSRVKSTALLSETLSKLTNKPKVFIIASGINIYGENELDAEPFTETSSELGIDFLAEVVRSWEEATKLAQAAGIRVCFVRLSAVLGPTGGLLCKVLPMFKMAAGGRLGNGKQMMSWISIEDAVAAIHHCLIKDEISGPVNLCTKNVVSNREFTKALAKAVGMPSFIILPAFIITTVLGEMGSALMLSSITCSPSKLEKTGFEFTQPTLRECLNFQLKVDVQAIETSKDN